MSNQQPPWQPYQGQPHHGQPHHGYQGRPQPAQPYPQHPSQHAAPYPGGGYPGAPQEGRRPPKRGTKGKVFLAIAGVVVVVAAAVTGVVLYTGGGSGGGPDFAERPGAEEVAFPDLGKLGYDAGPDAVCESLGKIMTARGYERAGSSSKFGITCFFDTPAASVLKDGTTHLSVGIFVIRGADADRGYRLKIDSITRFREKPTARESFVLSELTEFPSGDEGFFAHSEFKGNPDKHSLATVGFRSGDDTVVMEINGSIRNLSGDQPNDAMPEAELYGEAVDIVKAMNGDGSAGAPRIKPAPTQEYPGLPPLKKPRLAEGDGADGQCAAITTAAQQLVMKLKKADVASSTSTVLCHYDHAADYHQKRILHRLEVTVRDFSANQKLSASGELGRDLLTIFEQAAEKPQSGDKRKSTQGPLYSLPVGTSGYMVYTKQEGADGKSSAWIKAAYVQDNIYYRFYLTGARFADGTTDPVALPEEQLVADLLKILTAMDR
ncbi:hypothetical protein F4560_000828 [Saccharothrix ecbatanensis]|uniref:Uncharacterized protein n=1 Tax=Saccharothrix ecbatanensis TaxID=1105145 RepID=A0A7W9HF58_9PSEU|nr:proline-rich domain-containing protein [Saccharothrix ecbatanensis]MBB5801060.1 hypothetical protein [Saccharothrix ecbatanensis]